MERCWKYALLMEEKNSYKYLLKYCCTRDSSTLYRGDELYTSSVLVCRVLF